MKSNSIYEYCPVCFKPGISRERSPNGNTYCADNHSWKYPDGLIEPKHNSLTVADVLAYERVKARMESEKPVYAKVELDKDNVKQALIKGLSSKYNIVELEFDVGSEYQGHGMSERKVVAFYGVTLKVKI